MPNASGAAGDPEEERYRLYQAVTGFLHNAAAVQPLVIVLEDLHDADRGTLDLLVHLASNAGHTQSRTILFQELYGRDYDGMDRMLDVRISQLRKKLGETDASERIKTIWGHGYLFVADAW